MSISSNFLLLVAVAAPAYDIVISPMRSEYAVNDVISCSAKGFPEPKIHWVRRREEIPAEEEGISAGEDDIVVERVNLTVTEDMVGLTNSWTCMARNDLNTEPLTLGLEFTITAGTYVGDGPP